MSSRSPYGRVNKHPTRLQAVHYMHDHEALRTVPRQRVHQWRFNIGIPLFKGEIDRAQD